jgi:hypothetical protein
MQRVRTHPYTMLLTCAAVLTAMLAHAQTPTSPESAPTSVLTTAPTPMAAPATAHENYAKPWQAVRALLVALKSGDSGQLRAVFGPGSDDLIDSGDPVADKKDRAAFLSAYKTKHVLVSDGADRKYLVVGAGNFQLPTPIVQQDGRWRFDGATGANELVLQRIGRNELDAIATCKGIVAAQAKYFAWNPEKNAVKSYAGKFMSDPGRRDGLYWPAKPGKRTSPAGPFVAQAEEEGYTTGAKAPYRGYYFRLLTAQGPAASGGAKSYLVDGSLTGGFAVVAWPAQYRASGVMTFIVNQDGIVFQKDLGDDTEKLALGLAAFDPDTTWTPAESAPGG